MIEYVSTPFGVTPDERKTPLVLFKLGITKFLSKVQDLLSAVKDKITRYSLWYFSKP
jgi:hypothetical protein